MVITARVRVNKQSGQKILTVPRNAPLYRDDVVLLTKLEEPTQMNNDKEVQNNGRDGTGDIRRIGYDSNSGTSREQPRPL